jgi:spoIIIJ-associated protein
VSKLTVTAKTVEEAVKSALSQLQTSEEFINIRVIEEPSKGFFGFGSKKAVVEVELKKQTIVDPSHSDPSELNSETSVSTDGKGLNRQLAIQEAQNFIEKVLIQMGLDVQVLYLKNENEDEHVFQVQGEGVGMMIGRRGQTLDSIQYLTNLVANRYSDDYLRIVVDPENYRSRRKDSLVNLAERVAKKVLRTRQKVVLEPMNPAERKIIHSHLQNYSGISTKSEGEGSNRRIAILPK